jgi:hypothetical protein
VHTRRRLQVLCGASEYNDLPVRHNEDQLNLELAQQVGSFRAAASQLPLPWPLHPPCL